MPESYVLQQLVFPQHQDEDILGGQRDGNVSNMSLQCAQLKRRSRLVELCRDIPDEAGQSPSSWPYLQSQHNPVGYPASATPIPSDPSSC